MRVIATISCCITLCTSSLSQPDCLKIRGKSGEPVSYATVLVKKSGAVFIADSMGKVCRLNYATINLGDTVSVSAVGYEDVITTVDKSWILTAEKSFKILPEVMVVNGEGKEEVWGTKRNHALINGFGGGSLGFRYILNSTARIIYSEGEFKQARIESVAFYDNTGKGMNVPVRVRIFFIGKDSLPAGDYLTDNLIVSTSGKGWLEINLTDKGLLFPKEGLIFGIELFADSDEHYFKEKVKTEPGKSKKMVTNYGFSLAFEKGDEAVTMIKYPGWRNRWFIIPPQKEALGNLVCRVKVKVWR